MLRFRVNSKAHAEACRKRVGQKADIPAFRSVFVRASVLKSLTSALYKRLACGTFRYPLITF